MTSIPDGRGSIISYLRSELNIDTLVRAAAVLHISLVMCPLARV